MQKSDYENGMTAVSSTQYPRYTPAKLIADNLAALPHPDGTARQMPGFNAHLLPDGMRAQVQQTAQDIGEAIVHLLETNGHALGEQPAQPVADPVDVAHLHCLSCDTRLLSINVSGPIARTNGTALLRALAVLNPECPHGPI